MHVYKHAYVARLLSTITIFRMILLHSAETSMGSEAPDPADAASVPLVRLNHVSFQCTSVEKSVDFYHRVLGFELIKRPESLNFEGAWLYKYGMGIHLLQRGDDADGCSIPTRPLPAINPMGNHVSFQCSDMAVMKARLRAMDREFVVRKVWDGETVVDQLFFHDPDGNMIEVCNCENLPVIPLVVAAAAGADKRPWLA
uniref:VOC domain-containing protein n=1 Tax=Oryza punctata TaxID=4537 RepID=A0A0E0KTB4_ORYPU